MVAAPTHARSLQADDNGVRCEAYRPPAGLEERFRGQPSAAPGQHSGNAQNLSSDLKAYPLTKRYVDMLTGEHDQIVNKAINGMDKSYS